MMRETKSRKRPLPWQIPAALLVGELALILALVAPQFLTTATSGFIGPETQSISGASFTYRHAGAFQTDGQTIDAPQETVKVKKGFDIMTDLVSVADYQLCVDAGACKRADISKSAAFNLPITGVSFNDANDYAIWLSQKTGADWRLPTDQEWALAAGDRFVDTALGVDQEAANNPALRWIAEYQTSAAATGSTNRIPQTIGSFGTNQNGLRDIAGNIWEWTDDCYARTTLTGEGAVLQRHENCGVRVVEGAHRTYISAFIRDARSGGCTAGSPPDNLGFRLVKAKKWWHNPFS